jgi:hypothetical protein
MADPTQRGEPTLPGNPHQITKRQHVLPKASIQRFADGDGLVDCYLLKDCKIRRVPPGADVFCASRVWDHGAEAGPTTKRVEDTFQDLVDKIVCRQLHTLDASENETATAFFALMIAREETRRSRPEAVSFPGRSGHDLSLEEQECLEKVGYIVPQNDGTLGSRAAAGIRIMGQIVWAKRNMADWRWGIVRSPGPEFIVPDVIAPLNFIPIGPRVLLAAGNGDLETTDQGVSDHNRRAREVSEHYYFAKRLNSDL